MTRGGILVGIGDLDGARREDGRALRCFQAVGDAAGQAALLSNLADTEFVAGDLAAAAAYLTACEPLVDHVGDVSLATGVRHNLGMVEALRGDHTAAHHYFTAALMLAHQTHQFLWLVCSLIGCAHSLTEHDPTRAATIHGAADTRLARLENHLQPGEAHLHNTTRTVLQTRLTPTDYQSAYKTGTQLPLPDVIAIATGSVGDTCSGIPDPTETEPPRHSQV